jgi:hypothetical protein
MTLPLEVSFWNMPREAVLVAAVKNELHAIESVKPITSCRVNVKNGDRQSEGTSYEVQIVLLTGSKLLRARGDSASFHFLNRLNANWLPNEKLETAEPALRRAFARIHAQICFLASS